MKPISLYGVKLDANIVMVGNPKKHLPYISIKVGESSMYFDDKDLWRLERMVQHCRRARGYKNAVPKK